MTAVLTDIFDEIKTTPSGFDVVLCLGFLYHTLRYNELMFHLRGMEPGHLIIDTGVIDHEAPVVRLRTEPVSEQRNAIADAYSWRGGVLSGEPSVSALERLLSAYDFEVERMTDWTRLLRRNPNAKGVQDYANGRRVTVCARAVDGAASPIGRSTTSTPSVRRSLRSLARDFAPPIITRWVNSRRRR